MVIRFTECCVAYMHTTQQQSTYTYSHEIYIYMYIEMQFNSIEFNSMPIIVHIYNWIIHIGHTFCVSVSALAIACPVGLEIVCDVRSNAMENINT